MRIACLQFSPQVGDVNNNLNRADAVLNKSQDVDNIDLLVLPELAFTGYNFRSLSEITPFLEPSGSGISALWARTTALKFDCNVVVGYPEKVDVTQKWPASPEFYNSAIIVSKDGETIANYRKSFLYAVDETWALEGQDGFFEGYIDGLGDVAMGICMDLNPYRFEAPWHNFEFAYHILEVKANLVILTMAWLTREGAHAFSQLPQEPDLETLEYWVQRLEPLIRKESQEEIIVVLCNRAGTEGDAVYAGTSSVVGIKNGEVNLYGVLGRGVKELLVVDTEKAPFAKLLRTSHGRKSDATKSGAAKSVAGKSDGYDSNQSHYGSSPNVSRKSTPFPSKRFHPFRDVGPSEGYDNESQGTPIDDLEDAWEIMSTTASHGSAPSIYSHSGPMPPRNSMPKLELKIPDHERTHTPYSHLKGPVSATRGREAKSPAVGADEIPTPTAPSPTPMNVRPHFNTPDKKPPGPAKKDVIPSSVNKRGGGNTVKVKRADTPMTPPLRSGNKEKARGPTPISEAPPSPPSDEEGARTGTPNPRGNLAAAKKSQKQPNENANRNNGRDDRYNYESARRPRASSLSTQADRSRSYQSASVVPGLMTAAPTSMTTDSMWADVLRSLEMPDTSSRRDSMHCQPDLDDILVGESSSQVGWREDELFPDVQREFAHLVSTEERRPSPGPVARPERPPSTKSRNASYPRLPQGVDEANLRRSMSQSRMSIPILASPGVFQQEPSSQPQTRRSESPIYLRPENKGSNTSILPHHHRRQSSEPRYDMPSSYKSPRRLDSPAVHSSTPTGNSTPSQGGSGSGVLMKPASRPVSRGRQPFTKTNATNGSSTPNTQWSNGHTSRASDSVDRGRRISNSRATDSISRSAVSSVLSSRDRSMSTSSASWLFGTPPPTRTEPPLDPGDEIIAMINLIHNGCPVHNSRAPSLEPQSQSRTVQQNRSQSQNQNHDQSQVQGQVQAQGQGQRQGRHSSQQRDRQSRQRQSTPGNRTPNQHPASQQLLLQQQQNSQTPAQGGGEEPVYEIILPPHIRDLVESLSNQEPRIQSPLRALDLLRPDRATPKFDPPTPTAMQFDINDEKGTPATA